MDWEDKFRRLRKDSEEGKPSFLVDITQAESISLEATPEPLHKIEKVKESVNSEKAEILSGLKNLAEEKQKTTGAPIKFPGGEVSIVADSLESSEISDIVALSQCQQLDVLFVYNYSSDALELPEEVRHQAPSIQLLERMIKAMKMSEGTFESLVVEEDERETFLNKLAENEIKMVVPMGAVATNLVLGKQERLSQIHGKFFTKELRYKNGQVRKFEVIPVFNPEMILINPNMKRSAWLDLQKIMEKLNIPTA